ncbi:unnamed protein product [Rhizoctonia solani]|uniref:Uncharacterized protein n=1 Tax=Rhizoctonia solani TaxID=456999 RepID=A0A8H2WD27_9AGAM|nr:unnamed protein product [Rhizoctonia solani]
MGGKAPRIKLPLLNTTITVFPKWRRKPTVRAPKYRVALPKTPKELNTTGKEASVEEGSRAVVKVEPAPIVEEGTSAAKVESEKK